MPVESCTKEGEKGFKWGEQGACFTGPEAREKAEAVGKAIKANENDRGAEIVRKEIDRHKN